MNRTHLILAAVAALSLVALLSGPRRPAPAPVVAPALPASAPAPSAPPAGAVWAGPLTLTAKLSAGKVLAGSSAVDVLLDVTAADRPAQAHRVPLNLAVAIDHSGSMAGQKLEQARAAARALLGQLQVGDRICLVAFSSGVRAFPSAPVNPETLQQARAFVDGIFDSGSTNISGALARAVTELGPYASQFPVSRVVLLSDGVPTMGETDPAALARLAAGAREHGVTTSAYGLGHDFNAGLMRDIAAHGAGTYAFVEHVEQLGVAFATELQDASRVLARQVRVQLTVPQGVTLRDVPGHLLERRGSEATVRLYDFTPGQSAQMLVRLQVSAPAAGDVELTFARLSAADLEHDRPVEGALRLTAAATASTADVEASKNAEVVAMGTRVDVSVKLLEATTAYESGDSKSAIDILSNVRRMFGASADALAGTDLERIVERNGFAAGEDQLITRKTMKNFGANNTAQY